MSILYVEIENLVVLIEKGMKIFGFEAVEHGKEVNSIEDLSILRGPLRGVFIRVDINAKICEVMKVIHGLNIGIVSCFFL